VYNPKKIILTLGIKIAVDDIQKNKLIVVKHNDLIDAAQLLSVYESRIVLTCIAQIDSTKPLDASVKFSVSVNDIVDLVGLNGGSAYDDLKKAVERLSERWIYFLKPSMRVTEAKTRWVSYVGYVPKEGIIELYFTPHIIPLLSDINKNFTQYKVINVLQFKSIYSFRLYELICRWGGKTKTIRIEELKQLLEIENKYDRIDNFKKWIIDESLSEINKTSNVTANCEYLKRGKRITHLKFDYVIIKKETNSQNKNNVKKINKSNDSKSNEKISNLEHYTNLRKRFGDIVPVPEEIEIEMKEKGLW
jgi:plasmid replication initiation protein